LFIDQILSPDGREGFEVEIGIAPTVPVLKISTEKYHRTNPAKVFVAYAR